MLIVPVIILRKLPGFNPSFNPVTGMVAAAGPSLPPSIPAQSMHKNRLQEFAQQMPTKLPIYNMSLKASIIYLIQMHNGSMW
jgi:hypothetical protein